MSRWTEKEKGHLRHILETHGSHSVHEMARIAHQRIKRRSVTAIAHKLRELISQEEFTEDHIELNGQVFPAKVVSGYVVITVDEHKDRLAHVWLWEQHYGSVPKGFHVHHMNNKRVDNRIENLSLMSADDHIAWHMSGRPPETATMFWFLYDKGMWEDYLEFREDLLDKLYTGRTKKP